MKNIKETITALTSGDFPGAVRVKKEEHAPMSDERFSLVLKRTVQIVAIVCGTVLVLKADTGKVAALAGLGGFLGYLNIMLKI